MDDKERAANQQEIEHFQAQRRSDRIELEKKTKVIIEQGEHIQFLQGIINDVIADLQGSKE